MSLTFISLSIYFRFLKTMPYILTHHEKILAEGVIITDIDLRGTLAEE